MLGQRVDRLSTLSNVDSLATRWPNINLKKDNVDSLSTHWPNINFKKKTMWIVYQLVDPT
jgi:hypothetical protein